MGTLILVLHSLVVISHKRITFVLSNESEKQVGLVSVRILNTFNCYWYTHARCEGLTSGDPVAAGDDSARKIAGDLRDFFPGGNHALHVITALPVVIQRTRSAQHLKEEVR